MFADAISAMNVEHRERQNEEENKWRGQKEIKLEKKER